MLKAIDIMTTSVISIKKDVPIYNALELMLDNKISGIPVVDDDMFLIGILSERDVLRLFYESQDGEELTVNEFMTQPAVHFDEQESLLDICDCLCENYFRRVPVTSKGKLVGIVSRVDIIKDILKLRRENSAI
jgi:CBS domain-containing protein